MNSVITIPGARREDVCNLELQAVRELTEENLNDTLIYLGFLVNKGLSFHNKILDNLLLSFYVVNNYSNSGKDIIRKSAYRLYNRVGKETNIFDEQCKEVAKLMSMFKPVEK